MKSRQCSLIFFFLFSHLFFNAYAQKNDTSEHVLHYQKQMAKRGSAPAQFKLGVMYETGLGASISLVLAARWYKQAARQKYRPAINRLAYLKIKKSGFKTSHSQWLKNLKRDALRHHGEALFLLGKMYSEGIGVEKSLTRGLSLLHEAEAKNISGSGTEIIRIQLKLAQLQEQYITKQEKAKTKHISIYSSKKNFASNSKNLNPLNPNSAIKTSNQTSHNKIAESLIPNPKIKNKNIIKTILRETVNASPPNIPEVIPLKKKSSEEPGLVINISKPIIRSAPPKPHPMDLICAGNNQFRRSCR